ncbi:D-hydantoinase [Coccomyxa subellipsoidea C-169]|uniref:dihydropyrimidinase n=1 Tax=Coccomyxa subellipsoidea (strain C-169) TaxID=574566 RepID=I0Z9H3_COCSC|nr:D-hydantoinase [Coccomyxa subellipsoidea C-169]EIE27292.1 D-hydantoinase [Coccomyxa subellipsoidea C-169]|eukprot:XP_005651836.1 D-hydantoinase [Coccomyxa subellipsoidea C-169]
MPQGGTVVNAENQFVADVIVKDGLVESVGKNLKAPKQSIVVDATGKYVMPGGIDPHTHLDAEMGWGSKAEIISTDDFYSGQAAALAGGTTMHIDFALPIKGDLAAGFERYKKVAKKSVMDYGFHMAVTTWNDKVASDMGKLTKEGINSFKFFLAYSGSLAVDDAQLIHGFRRSKELGALPIVHCENAAALLDAQQRTFDSGFTGPEGHYISRPAVFEDEGTARALRLAQYVNVPVYIVHVMSGGAVAEIAAAKTRGQRVVGEAVASGFGADEAKIWDPDFKVAAQYVMSPPIRNKEHQRQIKAGLAGGVLSIVATDHAPFNSTAKRAGLHDFRKIPNGVNGIEERLHVAWDELVNPGLITPSDFVRLMSTAVAQTYNVYPRKGLIAPGSDADIIVFDPEVSHTISASTHHSRMDTNIYEGREVKGQVVVTISQGKVVWENGKLNIQEGAGRFVKLPVRGPLFEGLDALDAASVASNFPYGTPGQPVVRDLGTTASKDEL